MSTLKQFKVTADTFKPTVSNNQYHCGNVGGVRFFRVLSSPFYCTCDKLQCSAF